MKRMHWLDLVLYPANFLWMAYFAYGMRRYGMERWATGAGHGNG